MCFERFHGFYCSLLTNHSMTCRLPQTPRTPTAAAAHYFDDIWSSQGKPKKPSNLRRSSTRSIGFRSDWETSTNNDDDEATTPIKRTNSIGYLNAEALQRKLEMDEHVANYVSDQLRRVKTGAVSDVDVGEFETTLDGASDEKANGKQNGGSEKDGYFSR